MRNPKNRFSHSGSNNLKSTLPTDRFHWFFTQKL